MNNNKNKVFEIRDANKALLHSYTLKNTESLDQIAKLALEDAAAKRIPLHGAQLPNVVVENAVLTGIDLTDANLKGAIFRNSNLDDATLLRADLNSGKLLQSSFKRTCLSESNLQHSAILRSNLSQAEIINANFSGSLIHRSTMDNMMARIGYSLFEGAVIFKSSMKDTEFSSPFMVGTKILMSDLSGSSLLEGQLNHAEINRCNIKGLDLTGARGDKTRFINSPLDQAIVDRAFLTEFQINNRRHIAHISLMDAVANLNTVAYQSIPETPDTMTAEMLSHISNANGAGIAALKIQHKQMFGDVPFGMRGQDLSGKKLDGLDLSGMDFSGSRFTGASLVKTSLDHSLLDGTIINGRENNTLKASGLQAKQASFKAAHFEHVEVPDAQLQHSDLAFTKFYRCTAPMSQMQNTNMHKALIAQKSNFSGSNLTGSQITHSEFHDSKVQIDFRNSKISSVKMDYCDISGSDFQKSEIFSLNINHCDANNIVMNHLSPTALRVAHSDVSGADFSESVLTHCGFKSSDLSDTNFNQALIKSTEIYDTDFKGADLDQSCFIDSRISCSNIKAAKNIPSSALVCAGYKAEDEHKPLDPADSARYLAELRSKLVQQNSSSLDLS